MRQVKMNSKSIEKNIHGYPIRIFSFDCVDSTNRLLKNMASEGAPEGSVIIADMQTEGHGRLGRDFFSPSGTGLYMSILLRPQLSAQQSLLITTCAAVAAAEAIEKLSNKYAGIKWVNDIYIGGRKVCGILTEGSIEGDCLKYAVLGVGINLLHPDGGFPEDLRDSAGAVFSPGETTHTAEELRSMAVEYFLDSFLKYYSKLEQKEYLDAYRSRSIVYGKEITVIPPDTSPILAVAGNICDDFSLLIRFNDGSIQRLQAGEVSIKLEPSNIE